jgi:hypothetical protein
VKDISHDVHIRVFKKAIKTNGETMEVDIMNLFGFILQDTSQSGVKTLYKIILTTHLMNWKKHFASVSGL